MNSVGVDDAVQEDGISVVIEQNVDGEEVATVSGEVVVDGETTLRVERLCPRRLW